MPEEYGDVDASVLVTPVEFSEEGRSGSAGVDEEVLLIVDVCELTPVDDALPPAGHREAPVAPACSQGFGGDGIALRLEPDCQC